MEMLRVSEGTREQQYGNTIIAAHPPDFRATTQLAAELAQQTRDLRIAVLLIEGQTHDRGLDGLADGLELLRHWVCDLWDSVHPQLDPADDFDPFIRINSLGRLCEPERLIAMVGKMALVEAPPHIIVTLDDARWVRGEQPQAAKADRPTEMEVEAAFLSLSLGELRQRYDTSRRGEASLMETVRFLEGKAGKGVWDASELIARISACSRMLKEQLRKRLSAADSVVTDVVDDIDAGEPTRSATDWKADNVDESITSLSRIRVDSREDAAQVIEAATRYFETYEPSSPVPLLLRRAKKMINQGFVDILRDLAPEALASARSLAGEVDVESH